MFKIIWLFKRKEGMSLSEFVNHYENTHSKFIKHAPGVRRYFRRYLSPLLNAPEGPDAELAFDVVMEMWFDNRAAFDLAMANLSRPEIVAEIVADEQKLFGGVRMQAVVVEEHETTLVADAPRPTTQKV